MDTMPTRVWLRKCGGGLTLPGGKPYLTVVGDDRELPRHVKYVRADDVSDLVKALAKIVDLAKPGQSVSVSQATDIICDIWNEAGFALSKAEGHIGQELAPDPERRGTAK